LLTIYTAVVGQNDWYVFELSYNINNPNFNVEIKPEPNRGKILMLKNIPKQPLNLSRTIAYRKESTADLLWSQRTNGNNILKLEYDVFFGPNLSSAPITSFIGLHHYTDMYSNYFYKSFVLTAGSIEFSGHFSFYLENEFCTN